jgi:D-serine deaminase-like pyridoxal phosphate-dependent protein
MGEVAERVLQAVDTPAVLVDLERVERNLARGQALIAEAGLAARPHVKTHKIPALAQRQLALGAVGLTCQKVSEAEVFAAAGCTDILIPYNILGDGKLGRLHALARQVTLSVSADSVGTLDGLSRWFDDPARRLDVLVECDTGQHRCGVRAPEAAAALAQAIAGRAGLRFAGLMTYPPRARAAEVDDWLTTARDLCRRAGLPVPTVSNGGTPGLAEAGAVRCATEFRAGTYIYNDRSLVAKGLVGWADCALVVAATVVSRPSADLAIIDAGSKILTSDLMGLAGYGHCPDYPGAVLRALNEEHGYLDLDRVAGRRPELGEAIAVIPNHACVVSNMVDAVVPHRDGQVMAPLAVAARGKVT